MVGLFDESAFLAGAGVGTMSLGRVEASSVDGRDAEVAGLAWLNVDLRHGFSIPIDDGDHDR